MVEKSYRSPFFRVGPTIYAFICTEIVTAVFALSLRPSTSFSKEELIWVPIACLALYNTILFILFFNAYRKTKIKISLNKITFHHRSGKSYTPQELKKIVIESCFFNSFHYLSIHFDEKFFSGHRTYEVSCSDIEDIAYRLKQNGFGDLVECKTNTLDTD